MALTKLVTYLGAEPESKMPQHALMCVRGSTDGKVYVLDADPVTGAIAVSFGGTALDFGVSTAALRVAAQIGNATGAAAFGTGADSAQTLRTTLSTRHEAAGTPVATRPSNGANFAAFGAGAVAANVIRTTPASDSPHLLAARHEAVATPLAVQICYGGAAVPPASSSGRAAANAPKRNDYGSTPVTTAGYVQMVAALTAAANRVQIFDSSGQTLVFAVGGAGVEVDQFLVPPGGITIDLAIPIGSRISLKAISGNATAGECDINFLT